jgi:hypothetical protein
MAITPHDIALLVQLVDSERDGWINGVPPETTGRFRQDEEMTILGPFGGPGVRRRDELGARQQQVNSWFRGGTGTFELIKTLVEGDLAVIVGIERSLVQFEGHDDPRPGVLRSTQVFRKSPEGWVRLHRHADPLISPRSLDDTLSLLADK